MKETEFTSQTNSEIPHEKLVDEDQVESEERSTHKISYPNGTK